MQIASKGYDYNEIFYNFVHKVGVQNLISPTRKKVIDDFDYLLNCLKQEYEENYYMRCVFDACYSLHPCPAKATGDEDAAQCSFGLHRDERPLHLGGQENRDVLHDGNGRDALDEQGLETMGWSNTRG